MGTGFYLRDDFPGFGSAAFTPPLPTTGMVEIVGAPGHAFKVLFGAPLRDPVFQLGSLGSILTFPADTVLARLSGDAGFRVADNTVIGEAANSVVAPDGTLGPSDSNGTVRLTGSFTSIQFTLTPNFADGTIRDGVHFQIGGIQSLDTSPVELGGTPAPVQPPPALGNGDNELIFDRSKGWPPQLAGNSTPVGVTPSPLPYTFADWERYLRIAVSHSEVKGLIDDGFIWLGCHLLKTRAEESPVQVLVALRNPTAAEIIEVKISGEAVSGIEFKAPWHHPESPTEMATAIELVTSHPEHGQAVAGLIPHAILRVPDAPNEPSNGHRCLHVMFTQADDRFVERLVCFSALVDLQTRQVVATRKSPCE
ncbi:hypothetical protein ACFPH6_08800 [Streptomyces xiangluensis]|uniref:Uncharacterized protein n=1 Tax=Streptomyces xiangluensis TaxID=2665720 RepID=A0ABV8YH81_9ACTN